MSKKSRKKQKQKIARKNTNYLNIFSSKPTINLLIIVTLSLILSIVLFDSNGVIISDAATYVILAKSLIQGKGFSVLNSPLEPLPKGGETYPFGYPVIIAFFYILFGGDLLLLRTSSIILFLVGIYLSYLFFKRKLDVFFLSCVIFLIGINASILQYTDSLLSEMAYFVFSILAILMFEEGTQRYPKNKRGTYYLALSVLLIVFTYYIRSVGIALIISAVIFFIIKRDYKMAGIIALSLILLLLPWYLRNKHYGLESGYIRQLFLKDYYAPNLGTFEPIKLLIHRLSINLPKYFIIIIPKSIVNIIPEFIFFSQLRSILWCILSLFVMFPMFYGYFFTLLKKKTILEIYIFFYISICLLWPEYWGYVRFIIGVIPFFIYYFIIGVKLILKKVGLSSRAVKFGVLFIVALLTVSHFERISFQANHKPMDYDYGYVEAAKWLKENTPPNSVVIAKKPGAIYLYSDRKSADFLYTDDTEKQLHRMRELKANFIIADKYRRESEYLWNTLSKYREMFHLMKEIKEPKPIYIFRFEEDN